MAPASAHGDVSALLNVAGDEAGVDERLLPGEGATKEEADHAPGAAAAASFSAAVATIGRVDATGRIWGPQVGDGVPLLGYDAVAVYAIPADIEACIQLVIDNGVSLLTLSEGMYSRIDCGWCVRNVMSDAMLLRPANMALDGNQSMAVDCCDIPGDICSNVCSRSQSQWFRSALINYLQERTRPRITEAEKHKIEGKFFRHSNEVRLQEPWSTPTGLPGVFPSPHIVSKKSSGAAIHALVQAKAVIESRAKDGHRFRPAPHFDLSKWGAFESSLIHPSSLSTNAGYPKLPIYGLSVQ
jgi:hypothetical protein